MVWGSNLTGLLRSLAETCGDPGKSRVISERASRIGGGVRLHIPATAVQQMTNTLPDRTHTHGVCPLWYSVLQPPHGALPPAVSPKRPNKASPVTPRGDLPYQSDVSEDHSDTSRTNVQRHSFLRPARLREAVVSLVRRRPRGLCITRERPGPRLKRPTPRKRNRRTRGMSTREPLLQFE